MGKIFFILCFGIMFSLSIQVQKTSAETVILSISSNSAVSVEQPLQHNLSEKKRQAMLKIIAESEQYYTDGVDCYNRGERSESRRYFRKALKKFSSAGIEHNLLYSLSDKFDDIFQDLANRLNLIETTNGDIPEVITPAIPVDEDDPLVQKYIAYFTGSGRKSIQQAFERMGIYREIVMPVIKAHRLPEELAYLPIIESRYCIGDVSHAGAAGIWQFMENTARGYDMRVDYWIDERRDPEKSTQAALTYLKNLYYLFNDWHLALAAYNRGEYGISSDLQFSRTTDFKKLAKHNAIPNETERYVPQFMAVILLAQNPEKYGFTFTPEKPLEYDIYETNEMIDLEIAAQCAHTSKEELRALNPAITAWCTPKNYPGFKLKLPVGSRDLFIENLKNQPDLCPAREFIKYKIKQGDYLGKIARTYHTSVNAIKQDNGIKNERLLMPGKTLIIKPGRGYNN
ncbi:MAG: transglycosylase SLT domain-containing protein [bacterium]